MSRWSGPMPGAPSWLRNSIIYQAMTGSISYGTNTDESDIDIVGVGVPPREVIWPPGYIEGFGEPRVRFEEWGQTLDHNGRSHDVKFYNIVKFFNLAMQNNPNMVDVLFVPDHCIQHITNAGTIMRENRKLFLHKGSWHKFKGYAYSQLHKMDGKHTLDGSKRATLVAQHGYDTKFAAHVVRLMLECEQILVTHDLDLQRDKEVVKAVRQGAWTQERVRDYFSSMEKRLEDVYESSTLRYSADVEAIKSLMLQVIDAAYGVDKRTEVMVSNLCGEGTML